MTRFNTTEKSPFLNLLEESFPGIKANILRCEKLGFPWNSKPFLKEEKGEILSHVGFLEYPISIDGKQHRAAALHAICTTTTHRGQGLASQLIQEALQWAEKQYEFVILYTGIPKFYEKFDFQNIQEYRFYLSCKRLKGSKSLRPVVSPEDNALFKRCFHSRMPLSNYVWIRDDGDIASFNTLFATYPTFWSLHHSEFIDGIFSYEIKEKTLHLYDIITKEIPSLDLILEHLPTAIDDIYFYFSPDQFTNAAIPEPYLYDHGHFLVHGNWPSTKPFMIPPLSRCSGNKGKLYEKDRNRSNREKIVEIKIRTNNKFKAHSLEGKIFPIVKGYFHQNIAARIPNRLHPGTTYYIYTEYESDHQDDYIYFINEFPAMEGFSRTHLFRAKVFYNPYAKVPQLVGQLEMLPIFSFSWGHNIIILLKILRGKRVIRLQDDRVWLEPQYA